MRRSGRSGRSQARARRAVIALVAGLSLVLVVAGAGLAADPGSPSSDRDAHDAAVAAAIEAAIASGADPSGSSGSTPGSGTTSPGSGGSATAPGTTAVPSPTPAPTPTPMPTITPPPRAATLDGPVPSAVRTALKTVKSDIPTPYYDGCHVWLGGTMPAKSCLYGHLTSHTTIAIYGDSHALAWFPAVLRAVNDKGWRLLNVTMAGCTPADIIPASSSGQVLTACVTFRKAALAKLSQYHPAVILVTGTRGFATVDSSGHLLTGTARTNAWIAGMGRTLGKLIPMARRVLLVSDTPTSRFADPPGCIAKNLSHVLACATPVSYAISYPWINTEFHVALGKHVAYLDPERWVCPTSPCPLVHGSTIVFRDHGHMTAHFAGSLWRRMEAALVSVLADGQTVIGP